jgi:hypothetical protein
MTYNAREKGFNSIAEAAEEKRLFALVTNELDPVRL